MRPPTVGLAAHRAEVVTYAVTPTSSSAEVTARGYAADVRDTAALAAALDRAAEELGPIEVLLYSPIPQKEFLHPVLDSGVADLRAAVEFSLYGPVTAVQHVLPGMRSIGRGTVLFVNGGSAVRPNPAVAGTSVAFAAEGAYGQLIHDTLGADSIYVGQFIIPGAITRGHPTNDPDVLAARLWRMHTGRAAFREFAAEMNLPGR
jgi:NAD(P)-dependent dehydrogenase (short-subunit alcohol dehydrogenase family)